MNEQDPVLPEDTPLKSRTRNLRWRRDAKRYFWDFMVIVAGIAVTFMISGWITHGREKKSLDGHLTAIKIELEENLALVGDFDTSYKLSAYLSGKMPEEHDEDSILVNSIYKDGMSVIYYFPTLTYVSSAYETLQASGMMNMIDNPQLLREIVRSYKLLEEAKLESDHYMQTKTQTMLDCALDGCISIGEKGMRDPVWRKYFYFMAFPYGISSVHESRKQIEKTLLLL